MDKLSRIEKWRIKWAIRNKCREFHRAGYREISRSDLEVYLFEFRWKRMAFDELRQRIRDIRQFSSNDFFDYQQLKIQTSQKSLAELDDFSDLF